MRSDESMQVWLNDWRAKEGDVWLESLGPIIREREMRGVERYRKSLEENQAL